jgi:coenzyme Q-binding protein COQ10
VPFASRALARSEADGREMLVADMTVAYKLFRESFTSRVTLDPGRLRSWWSICPVRSGTSRTAGVSRRSTRLLRGRFLSRLRVQEPQSPALMGSVFETAFSRFADAFERRADEVYGTASARQPQGADGEASALRDLQQRQFQGCGHASGA